ncbi:MAG: choice-of-anchor tandem repeat GloVer-containing protein [Steroidobacteraceae bacterium]
MKSTLQARRIGQHSAGGIYSAGTVFKVTKSGVKTQLWTFGNDSGGRNPIAALLLGADGNFYGATANGGASGLGTLFRMTPAGSVMLLWSFSDSDGETPFSTLIQGPDRAIYGTTYRGGIDGGGVVYKLTM